GIFNNAEMSDQEVKKYCAVSKESSDMLSFAFDKLHLSARAYNRILKVARTISDLNGDIDITDDAIMEAISYRTLDNKYWD
ncbi:MAG: magnesium chelatase, partial [Clostridia bacterium]|nr:magnesium chelatase [Clostridia bacterium]